MPRAVGFGACSLLAAVAPTFGLELAALVPLGAVSITFAAGINSQLQLAADPAMRGRVMALYAIVFLGSTPIGGPLTGWLSEAIDPRAGLVLAGVAGLVAALGARSAFARLGMATPRGCERPERPRAPHSMPTSRRREAAEGDALPARDPVPDQASSPA